MRAVVAVVEFPDDGATVHCLWRRDTYVARLPCCWSATVRVALATTPALPRTNAVYSCYPLTIYNEV
jgi:hypothetical protein